MEPKGRIFEKITEFFESDNWYFHQMQDKPILSMAYSGKNGRWTCYAQAREEQEQFVFYSVSPTNTMEERRQAMAEFITRANYGMVIGNFEMDFNDGEIRYKTSVDVEDSEITQPLIKHLVYANIITFDRYLPGLMQVNYGGITPEEAIQKIENPPADS